ncbi:MAG: hypothetical protein EXS08_12410 [Planctomycetes bacterium]|nr:hypothetical protein [Planctomycetota bacterium]
MGLTRSSGPSRAWSALAPLCLAATLVSACHLAPAKVWNLEQLHTEDGSPKHRGRVQGDLTYLLTQTFRRTNFGGPEFQAEQTKEKRIKDPLGTCLENVVELERCESDERVAGLQAAAFAWLAVDCTYLLSRERCVLALGELAPKLELEKAIVPAAGDAPTSAAVKALFDELVTAVRALAESPSLGTPALVAACERIRALPLDRAGTLRLLRAANAMLSADEGGDERAALRALRLELARRATTLALVAARADSQGRVRAAALEASVRAFPAQRAELLRWALEDPMEGVLEPEEISLRALALLERYGLPPTPEGVAPAEFARAWEERLVTLLRLQISGPHSTAACRALAKITGEPTTLRPEIWLARWRAQNSAPKAAADAPQ